MVNRTERLYDLVEELRRAAPDHRTAGQLAQHFSVSSRTIERDMVTLQEAGVPIISSAGRNGGYAIATDHALPPLRITPAEAMAVAVALARSPEGPLARASLSARRKVMAAMSASDPAAARHLANRIQSLGLGGEGDGSVVRVLQEAVADHLVVELRYRSADGTIVERPVEPIGLVSRDRSWYLMAWCRASDDHRSFRLERIEEARQTGEAAPTRQVSPAIADDPHLFD